MVSVYQCSNVDLVSGSDADWLEVCRVSTLISCPDLLRPDPGATNTCTRRRLFSFRIRTLQGNKVGDSVLQRFLSELTKQNFQRRTTKLYEKFRPVILGQSLECYETFQSQTSVLWFFHAFAGATVMSGNCNTLENLC